MPRRTPPPPRKPPRPLSSHSSPRWGLAFLRGKGKGTARPVTTQPVAPMDEHLAMARAASFRHHCRMLGTLWIGVGVTLASIGGVSLWVALATQAGELATVWPLMLIVGLGLGLIVTGVGAYRRSVGAIYLGMGLNATPLALGYVAVPLALIVLASRTIRLSRPPQLGVLPIRLVGGVLSRLAVATLAVYLAGLVGGVAGGLTGGLVGMIATATHYLTVGFGLSLLAAVSMGAVAGAGAAGFSGLVVGLTSGRVSLQVRALANLGGLVAGVGAQVGWVMFGTNDGPRAAALARSEFVVLAIITAIAAILGSGLGPLVGSRLARAFAGPEEVIPLVDPA